MKQNICEYGCNKVAQFQLKNGKYCCSKSYNSCPEKKSKAGLIISEKLTGRRRTDIRITNVSCIYCKKEINYCFHLSHPRKCKLNPDTVKKEYLRRNALPLNKKCEKCEVLHNGTFGSGRFCSDRCAKARNSSGKLKGKKNKKLQEYFRKKYPGIKKLCEYCRNEMILKQSRSSIKFCSPDCRKNGRKKVTNITRAKLSESTKKAYREGKEVYGGRTKWLKYKDIKVQGTYELRTCHILDKWKKCGKISDWEYTNDRVQYVGEDEKEHTYLLDFKIYEKDQTFWYLETKGYQTATDTLKWDAVRNKNLKLIVWFLEEIELNEKILGI